MYKAYLVPDATTYSSRSVMYASKQLLWDPRSESDAYALISPKTKGEMNKAESFDFTVLPANVRYNDFHKHKSLVILYDDDQWLFEGVVSSCPVDFYKQRKVTCSGPLSYACHSVQAPDEQNTAKVPKSTKTVYVLVPTAWYSNANPKTLGWYTRTQLSNGKYQYAATSDTLPAANTSYYYASDGDGENYSGITVSETVAINESISSHITRLLGVHNSQVDVFKRILPGTIAGGSGTHEFKTTNYRDTWTALKNDILEQFGRFFTITLDSDYNLLLNYQDLSALDSNAMPKVTIQFTKNMIEMAEENNNDDDIFTVLVPSGKDNLTVAGLSGHSSPEHNDGRMIDPYVPAGLGGNRWFVVVSPAAVSQYGMIIKTQSFSDAETADSLYSKAVEYIWNNFDHHEEYTVKGIDLKLLGESNTRIQVGRKCRILSQWHGVDERDLFVITAEHDLTSPENDSYKIGVPTTDRQSKNKKLTSQTASTAQAARASAASASSGVSQVASWLEAYFEANEGWLLLHNKFRNDVVSDSKMNATRFEQDEEHINAIAEKTFGVEDQDSGYILIPKPPYKKTGDGVEDYYDPDGSGRYKIPSEHNWYEKDESGHYYISTDNAAADPTKDYYIQRLAKRVSELDVGPGGLKATVDGNYLRSTYCSSWIQSNEESIIALTGHLYVDPDGHVHVTSGSGMRTDHEEENTTPTYIQVERTMYSQNPNPHAKKWYERALDSAGHWAGAGAMDAQTNDSYYVPTTDYVVDRSKYYYYKSNVRETFVAEYGVYDSDNLTGGIVARMINNPTFKQISQTVANNAKTKNLKPKEQGWYEYDESTGTFGLTLDTTFNGSISNPKYYVAVNNQTTYTDIWGEHVVVGKTADYSGMDPTTKSRVDKYIADHNLNGTITEIASDVVTVHALFARFIHWDDAEGDTLHVFGATFDEVQVENEILIGGFDYDDDSTTYIVGDTILTPLLEAHETYARDSLNIGSIQFTGDGLEGVTSVSTDASAIVTGFGTITTSGDTVTIPYRTAGMDDFDTTHVLSFDKPASLGTVTWSNGSGGAAAANKSLVVQTLGGKEFFRATVTIPSVLSGSDLTYERNGTVFGAGSAINGKPAIKATQNLSATWTDHTTDPSADDDVVWSKDLYFDATAPYNDGISVAKGKFGLTGPSAATVSTQAEAQSLNNATTLSYGSSYMVYKTYDGAQLGDKKYFKTPSKGNYRTYAKYGTTEYTSGTIPLSYGESITVYGQRKMDGDSNYQNATGIQIKAPNDNSGPSIDYSDIRVGNIDIKTTNPGSSYTELDWASTIASAEGHWFVFEAWISGQSGTRKYKINLT